MAIPETPITREEMYLDEIARNGGGGGGSGLPPVETADYGKFLKADDTTGELKWSDCDVTKIVMTGQYDSTTQKNYAVNANYTYQQVYDLVNKGKDVELLFAAIGGSAICRPYTFQQSQYGSRPIDLVFIGFFKYGQALDGMILYVSSANPSDTLRFEYDNYLPIYNPTATAKLVQNGSDLVVEGNSTYNLEKDQKFYTVSQDDTSYSWERQWYSTVYSKYSLMGGICEYIIKNDLTGQLYKNNGYGGGTFSPYTP